MSAQGVNFWFMMALLGQAVQTHQTRLVPPQGVGTDIQLDFNGHLSLEGEQIYLGQHTTNKVGYRGGCPA